MEIQIYEFLKGLISFPRQSTNNPIYRIVIRRYTITISGAFMSHMEALNMDAHMIEFLPERTIMTKCISKAKQQGCIFYG